MPALPATPVTVSCYVDDLYSKGTIRGGSLRPNLAAIGLQHRRYGLLDPTKDAFVASTRQGYVLNDAARAGGPPERSTLLSAECTLRSVHLALAAPGPAGLQKWGVVALGFLL